VRTILEDMNVVLREMCISYKASKQQSQRLDYVSKFLVSTVMKRKKERKTVWFNKLISRWFCILWLSSPSLQISARLSNGQDLIFSTGQITCTINKQESEDIVKIMKMTLGMFQNY